MRYAIGLSFVLLLAAVAGAGAGEGNWFPLELGWEWVYDIGGLESTRLRNVDQIWWEGQLVTVLRIEEAPDEMEYYISGGERSGFYLHGGRFETIFQGIPVVTTLTFEPPVPYIDPPLYVGKEWTVPGVVIIDVNGDVDEEAYLLQQAVVSQEEMVVPAGTFACFGFLPNLEYFALNTASKRQGPTEGMKNFLRPFLARGGAIEWFSDGYGLIQSGTGDNAMRLSSWTTPTPVAQSSWSRIKALF